MKMLYSCIKCVSCVILYMTCVYGYRFASRFGTKTAYESTFLELDDLHHVDTDSRNVNVSARTSEILTSTRTIPDWPKMCAPIQLNALVRHGIRNPGRKDIKRFGDVVDKMISAGIEETSDLYRSLTELKYIVNSVEQKSLLPEGRKEQQSIARTILRKYSYLLEHLKSEDVHLVVSTSQRTVESCESFISSWQQEMNSVEFNPEIHINDSLIRFFDHCNKYLTEVDEDEKVSLREYHNYQNENFHKISEKLNIKYDLTDTMAIAKKELKALYIMAAIEIATLKTDEIAKLFDDEDISILEYATDLKNYWKKSYGHEINYRQGCPLLVDIFKHMDGVIYDIKPHKAVIRFGHAETLLPLHALLGLHKDEPKLRAGNHKIHRNRKFQTSKISPFSSNIMFVLFECDENPTDGELFDKYMVQMLHNEVPLLIPGCNQDFCPFTKFKSQYQHILDTCDFESICNLDVRDEL